MKYLKTLEVLENHGWNKGAFKAPDGSHCLVGALCEAGENYPGAEDLRLLGIIARVTKRKNGQVSRVHFNDRPSTTFDDIWALLAEAAMLEDSK